MDSKYIDLKQLIVFVVVILSTIIFAQVLNYLVQKRLVKRNKLLLKDPTRLKFFSHVGTAFIYVIGFATAISQITFLKPLSTSLLAGAGLITVAVSFASQNALSNIISGFFIVLFKPFGVNDRLRVKDNIIGVVEDITLRHTILRDGENKRVIIPNALINNEIVVNYNYVEEFINKSVDLILHHESDIERAKILIRKIIMDHPKFLDTRDPSSSSSPESAIPIYISNISDKGITMQVVISGRGITDSNLIAFYLLEKLIIELPRVNAYFVQSDMKKANFNVEDIQNEVTNAELNTKPVSQENALNPEKDRSKESATVNDPGEPSTEGDELSEK